MCRLGGALILLTLTGSIASAHAVQKVTDLLRQAAVEAGCDKQDVRVSLQWAIGERVEIEVWCVPHEKEKAP